MKRVLVGLALLPFGIASILIGGWVFALVAAFFLLTASREYALLFRASGYQPCVVLIVGGTAVLVVDRALNGLANQTGLYTVLMLGCMLYHLLAFERGRDQAGTDFAISLAGISYLGLAGGYMISLRQLPEGGWWLLTVLFGVWLADSGAYYFGRSLGKHKLSPRLSPKKTWEGYLGGIVTSTLLTALLALLWSVWTEPGSAVTPVSGAVIGLVMGVVPTLGDLGESMFKRQAGVKDSGTLLPGHGGTFDRIDSWLWAGVVGYYLINWLWI